MSRRKQVELDPIEQLSLYKNRVELLMENELSKTGFGGGCKITFNKDGIIETVSNEPRSDLLIGFLGLFRQFVNDDEIIQQSKVYGTLKKHLTDEHLKEELAKAMKSWKQIMKTDGMSVVLNDKELSPKFVTDLWIVDAMHSYAQDPEKAEILKNIPPPIRAVTRYKFFLCIANACSVIGYFHFVITKAFNEGLLDCNNINGK